jgi:hypothetical protein
MHHVFAAIDNLPAWEQIAVGVAVICIASFFTFIAIKVNRGVNELKDGAATARDVKVLMWGRDQTEDEERNDIPAPTGFVKELRGYHEDLSGITAVLDERGRFIDRAIEQFGKIDLSLKGIDARLENGDNHLNRIDDQISGLTEAASTAATAASATLEVAQSVEKKVTRNGGDGPDVGDTTARTEDAVNRIEAIVTGQTPTP